MYCFQAGPPEAVPSEPGRAVSMWPSDTACDEPDVGRSSQMLPISRNTSAIRPMAASRRRCKVSARFRSQTGYRPGRPGRWMPAFACARLVRGGKPRMQERPVARPPAALQGGSRNGYDTDRDIETGGE